VYKCTFRIWTCWELINCRHLNFQSPNGWHVYRSNNLSQPTDGLMAGASWSKRKLSSIISHVWTTGNNYLLSTIFSKILDKIEGYWSTIFRPVRRWRSDFRYTGMYRSYDRVNAQVRRHSCDSRSIHYVSIMMSICSTLFLNNRHVNASIHALLQCNCNARLTSSSLC
jgi:hypothetical protein